MNENDQQMIDYCREQGWQTFYETWTDGIGHLPCNSLGTSVYIVRDENRFIRGYSQLSRTDAFRNAYDNAQKDIVVTSQKLIRQAYRAILNWDDNYDIEQEQGEVLETLLIAEAYAEDKARQIIKLEAEVTQLRALAVRYHEFSLC